MSDGDQEQEGLTIVHPYIYSGRPTKIAWEIQTSPFDIKHVENALDKLLVDQFNEIPLLQSLNPNNEVSPELKPIAINEGASNLIERVEGEERTNVIAVIAKNLQNGSRQTERDATNLPKLKQALPPDSPLAVPEVSALQHLVLPSGVELPCFFAEYLPYAELSIAMEIGGETFFANNAAPFTAQEQQVTDQLTSEFLSKHHIVQGLAQSMMLIYTALDGTFPADLRFNNGDMVIRRENNTLHMGIITLNGDLLPVEPKTFIRNVIFHTEQGFHPVYGPQESTVMPFLSNPTETIQGLADGMKATTLSSDAIHSTLSAALQTVYADERFTVNTKNLRAAITAYIDG